MGRDIIILPDATLIQYVQEVLPRLKEIFEGSYEDSWRLHRYEKGGKTRQQMRLDCVLKHVFTDHQETLVKNEIEKIRSLKESAPCLVQICPYCAVCKIVFLVMELPPDNVWRGFSCH